MDLTMARIFLFIIFTSCLIKAEPHYKRSPEGFQGVRGKRDINDENQEKKREFENNHKILVATTTEKSFNDNENREPELLRGLPPLSVVKRAPKGFMGMRGKKDYEYTDFKNSDEIQINDNNELINNKYFLKRAPSGFMGMRGKKLPYNNYNSYNPYKRGPSGFVGMRGKKDYDGSSIHDINSSSSNSISSSKEDNMMNEFEMDFLERLQNKKKLLEAFKNLYGLDENNLLPKYGNDDEFEKRAPSAGFFGMRGKKEFNLLDEQMKRAPSAGFFGMRGKKWLDEINSLESLDKRAPLGFHGMRGKRAPSAGFFGMRGKKVPMGFFGMRGKKGPFEFRGKFVGVRGKKSSDDSLQKLVMNLNDLENNAISPADKLTRGETIGFIGSRGLRRQRRSTNNLENDAISTDNKLRAGEGVGYFASKG